MPPIAGAIDVNIAVPLESHQLQFLVQTWHSCWHHWHPTHVFAADRRVPPLIVVVRSCARRRRGLVAGGEGGVKGQGMEGSMGKRGRPADQRTTEVASLRPSARTLDGISTAVSATPWDEALGPRQPMVMHSVSPRCARQPLLLLRGEGG